MIREICLCVLGLCFALSLFEVDRRLQRIEDSENALRSQTAADMAALKSLCGPMIITTYERGETTITGPDGVEQ